MNIAGQWTQLPQSTKRRIGGSCGVLTDYDAASSTNITVIVMAGGAANDLQRSEFLRIRHTYNTFDLDGGWTMGPDVGETRSSILSKKKT